MSIPKHDKQSTFFDGTFLAQGLFDVKDRFGLFRKKVLPALEAMRDDLCQLYCLENSRPGIEPVTMAGVTLLQFMEGVPDRKVSENVRLHVSWKHTLDLAIHDKGFHPTSLVMFRDRLVSQKEGHIIIDAILQALHRKELVKRRGKQRLASTHILGAEDWRASAG